MAKTKRQLRAEAAERLENMSCVWDSDYIGAILGIDCKPSIDRLEIRDALVDLLTDDEAPEHERECERPYCATCKAGASAARVENGKLKTRVDELEKELVLSKLAESVMAETAMNCKHYCDRTTMICEIESLQGKVAELESQVPTDEERKALTMWPRFEDGTFVKLGDVVSNKLGSIVVEAIEFDSDGYHIKDASDGDWSTCIGEKPVKRPPILARDGQPIEAGQILYGEDGKAWTVTGFDRKRKWSVWAHDACNPESCKCLKPEWLTHEKPETLRDAMQGFREGICRIESAHNGQSYDFEMAKLFDVYAAKFEVLAKGRS